MTESVRPQRGRRVAVVEGWRAFWFKPEPAYALGLVRMAFGALAVAWSLALVPDLYELFGEDGAVPQNLERPYGWSIFEFWAGDSGDDALLIGWTVLLVSAIALTVGWHSRVAAIVVFVLIQSFMERGTWVFNEGDAVVRIEALILALSSCGAALSLDQNRKTGSFWSAQRRSPWGIRLMQVQLSLIYIAVVLAMLSGERWRDGTAASYVWRNDEKLALLPVPRWLSTNPLLVNLATWGTVLIALAIAVLVWNRRCLPWVLGVGVGSHLLAMATVNLGFFSLAVFVLYIAFIPWETAEHLPDTAKQLVAKSWARLRRNRISEVSTQPPSGHIEAPESPQDVRVNSSPGSRKMRGKHEGSASVDEIDRQEEILTRANPDSRLGC